MPDRGRVGRDHLCLVRDGPNQSRLVVEAVRNVEVGAIVLAGSPLDRRGGGGGEGGGGTGTSPIAWVDTAPCLPPGPDSGSTSDPRVLAILAVPGAISKSRTNTRSASPWVAVCDTILQASRHTFFARCSQRFPRSEEQGRVRRGRLLRDLKDGPQPLPSPARIHGLQLNWLPPEPVRHRRVNVPVGL